MSPFKRIKPLLSLSDASDLAIETFEFESSGPD